LVAVGEGILLDVLGVWMGGLLSQVQLAVHVEVVHLLQRHALLLLFRLIWVVFVV